MDTTVVEQRRETRTDITWPVSVWLPEANRFYNGKSINVSKGGVYISMPMTAPVRCGHEIEINFPRTTELAKQKGSYSRIKSGKVVRVERESILNGSTIGMAIQFAE